MVRIAVLQAQLQMQSLGSDKLKTLVICDAITRNIRLKNHHPVIIHCLRIEKRQQSQEEVSCMPMRWAVCQWGELTNEVSCMPMRWAVCQWGELYANEVSCMPMRWADQCSSDIQESNEVCTVRPPIKNLYLDDVFIYIRSFEGNTCSTWKKSSPDSKPAAWSWTLPSVVSPKTRYYP
jgi:hypothetical protein